MLLCPLKKGAQLNGNFRKSSNFLHVSMSPILLSLTEHSVLGEFFFFITIVLLCHYCFGFVGWLFCATSALTLQTPAPNALASSQPQMPSSQGCWEEPKIMCGLGKKSCEPTVISLKVQILQHSPFPSTFGKQKSFHAFPCPKPLPSLRKQNRSIYLLRS